jgi:hypothetical protein
MKNPRNVEILGLAEDMQGGKASVEKVGEW